MAETNNKQALVKKEEDNMVSLLDQSGIESAIGKLVMKNNSLLPSNVVVDRIKNSAGFYVANRNDLMELKKESKMEMLYGILKEAMLGLEAGTDYDIVPFKGKPVITRKKDGWFKIIDMIKPAEIIRFTNNVIFNGDDYEFNPVTEELKHIKNVDSDKYEDIRAAYCYIEFKNGFKKTIFMTRKDIDSIKKVSPSANTAFSPWTTMPVKMVKTKCVKEMAKELFTLFSSKVNFVLAQAIESDEHAVKNIDSKGYIQNDKVIYSDEFETEVQDEITEPEVVDNTTIESKIVTTSTRGTQVNLNDLG